MADLNKLLTPLFLNEGEIRKIIELLFFSYRDFTEGPDKVLEKINFGRAHHRVIYFVGKQKNLTIVGPFSFKYCTCIMKTLGDYMGICILPWNYFTVHPNPSISIFK